MNHEACRYIPRTIVRGDSAARPSGYTAWKRNQVARAAAVEREWLAEMDAMSEAEGLCYFAGNDEMVKIGFSTDVRQRLGAIRCDANIPYIELFATVVGGKHRETYYHQRFAAYRLHGEWFERSTEVLAEIARLSDVPHPSPTPSLVREVGR